MLDPCPFCVRDPSLVLWESDHYSVLADAFPRTAGHVLLVTKEHLPSHMHAPAAWTAELDTAQALVRRFLTEVFGAASFLENGGARQEVPHAHLHGVPFAAQVPPEWLADGVLRPADDWEVVRRDCQRRGYYALLETPAARYLLARDADYGRLLFAMRRQIVAQTPAELGPAGELLRGGPGMIANTIGLWQTWQAQP